MSQFVPDVVFVVSCLILAGLPWALCRWMRR